jgi:glycine betaine/proline transport system permease protein
MFDVFQQFFANPRDYLQVGKWVDKSISYLLNNDAKLFDVIGDGINVLAKLVEHALQALPAWLLIGLFVAISFYRLSWKFALFTAVSLYFIVAIGFWDHTVMTLALITTATMVSLFVGIPLGIWCAKDNRINALIRPILDFMQTMPAFVYLIPAAMLFGLGRVPGILATVIFAMPPAVRLTNLGIRHVNKEQVEAGYAFGSSEWQLLFKVQLPIALPSVMTGVNQTIMMALSMVIIASMVGAGGLGNDVLSSIQRLDIGLGFESGISVVLLAIVLDRITESFGNRHARQENA